MVADGPMARVDELGGGVDADCGTCESLRSEVTNLEYALKTSRTIGMAMGILIERHKLSPELAFEMLRLASQHGNRKLRDLALDLVYTGELSAWPPAARRLSVAR